TANSVLLITFADDERREGRPALEAALNAGFGRLRPVCMTALAMIIGMLPMALGLGEGGEQNAPLGRAVSGGLLLATCLTLVVLPVLYSILRVAPPTTPIVIPEGHAWAPYRRFWSSPSPLRAITDPCPPHRDAGGSNGSGAGSQEAWWRLPC